MADVYYNAQAVGAANGTSKADAYIRLLDAVNGSGVNDTIWASHVSAEINAPSQYTFSGQRLISVDFSGSTPPVAADFTEGASITSVAGGDIQLRASTNAYIWGIYFRAEDDFSCPFGVILMENCRITEPGGNDRFAITGGNLTLINTDIYFLNAGATMTLQTGNLVMIGGSVVGNPSIDNMCATTGNRMRATFIGVDLSDVTGTLILFVSNVFPDITEYTFINCLINAGVTMFSNLASENQFLLNYGTGDTNRPYYIQEDGYRGTIQSETTIVKTGGASDGITPISFKFITNANVAASYQSLFNQIPILFWAEAGETTFEIDLISDGLTLTEAEAWLELLYPQAGVLSAFASSLDRAGANLAASTVAWTTTGLSAPNKQKISLTVTLGQAGWVEAKLHMSRPSAIVYADVKILDGNQQYLAAGQAYINGPALACDNPPVGKVIEGTVYDFGNETGTYKQVPESKGEKDYQWGEDGIEFTGDLATFLATYELPQEIILEEDEIIIFEGCEL